MSRMHTNELLYKDEVYGIMGCAMEVHNEFNAGFAEAAYQESMEIEFGMKGIPFERKRRLSIKYKGRILQCEYEADLICFGKIIVETKATRAVTKADEAQLLNYLRATGLRVGLLINFGDPARLEWQRLIY